MNSTNIVWHERKIKKSDYYPRNGHRSFVVWFTGLSGSGKSTLAHATEQELFNKGCYTYILDGDNIRHGLNRDLSFSEADRSENIRRIGEVARLFVDAGFIVFAAFISPYREDRARVRDLFDAGEFIEVYVRCDLKTCEGRDPKGLYRKARAGELPGFTGIDSPYEEPLNAEIVIDTGLVTIEDSIRQVVDYIENLMTVART